VTAVRDLASFHGVHDGETIVVCGCGESLNDFTNPERFVTIGVNDVGRRFDPTYLVVVNPRSQFAADRYRYVEQSRAKYLFTQLDLRLPRDRIVRFRLGRYGGTTFTDPRVLHYTRNSPYVALCLAVHMGARRIGLVGVDFTEGHFFGGNGAHPLAVHFDGIDTEYRRLADALKTMGVEIVNLSRVSRLTAFARVPDLNGSVAAAPGDDVRPVPRPRIFAVNYRFLACGDVFTEGLRHAAAAAGVDWGDADWNDPRLPERVSAFSPDLVFVVHGRRFAQRWKKALSAYRTAVWLLDEPYEVDDTASFSGIFDHVFVNDPATLARHRSAVYLPVCHDPAIHYDRAGARPHDVGFIGGGNPARERLLGALASRGVLSYVVGGPWRDARLGRLARAANVPATAAADLYRATKIVVNVFRDRHHFNKAGVAARSMNPRIYEALACGALVVSEARSEIAERIPELPVFRDEAELVAIVDRYLASPAELDSARTACSARLAGATYAERLKTVVAATVGARVDASARAGHGQETVTVTTAEPGPMEALPKGEWEVCGPVICRDAGGEIELQSTRPAAPGSERGLVTTRRHANITLSFDARLPADGCFIAKINQAKKLEQCANSYHLYYDSGSAHLARHHCVFKTFELPAGSWITLRLACDQGVLSVFAGDRLVHSVRDQILGGGFAVLAVKRGTVKLRNIRLTCELGAVAPTPAAPTEGTLIVGDSAQPPRVSIVTTVYDRVEALGHCLRSVRAQRFQDYEHIVVSDCPPAAVVGRIERLVRSFGDRRISYLNLGARHNNWGIAPAAAGLRRTRGSYVCFLSDDNGYTPEHVGLLAGVLDQETDLGFVYSSCRYAGRLVLRHPVPAPARIDLGQPMFRRALFSRYLDDNLPFQMLAWDWALIDTFVQRGVRWRHVDVPSFIFRLSRYPQLMVRA
jgi:hypothetical protein